MPAHRDAKGRLGCRITETHYRFDGDVVGEFVADIIVNGAVIIELEAVRRILRAHEVQLVNYLVATGKPVGLILNFGERKVDIKRKVKDLT